MDEKALIRAALSAREKSYSPYSKFRVGAALLAGSGTVYTGCNIENAAYTPTVCAERTAFFKAVSAGERVFHSIVVAGGTGNVVSRPTWPCGVCRQVMMEFCDPEHFTVIAAISEDNYEKRLLLELLPEGFGPADLEDEGGK